MSYTTKEKKFVFNFIDEILFCLQHLPHSRAENYILTLKIKLQSKHYRTSIVKFYNVPDKFIDGAIVRAEKIHKERIKEIQNNYKNLK